MIAHHPNLKVIEKFVEGELSSALGSLVFSHLEFCELCEKQYREILMAKAKELDKEEGTISQDVVAQDLELVLRNIDLDSTAKKEKIKLAEASSEIKILGNSFILPNALRAFMKKNIAWKEFGKKSAIATVKDDPQGKLYFILLGPGESVPEHSHSDVEYSLVASGSYRDGISEYQTGDFATFQGEKNHCPFVPGHKPCLVVSWVEGRLNFFHGIFSPLNKLFWWYFHRL